MFDIHQAPVNEHGEHDEAKVEAYIEGLVKEYLDSPESKQAEEKLGDNGWAGFFLRYYFDYVDHKFAHLSVADFDEVVFRVFPRKVSTPAESAPEIIEALSKECDLVFAGSAD